MDYSLEVDGTSIRVCTLGNRRSRYRHRYKEL